MIKNADLVVVNLTDDISVGGSQEMLIAKYFGKHLLGIARRGGKFVKREKEIFGKAYRNYTDPFVRTVCDAVVDSPQQAGLWIREEFRKAEKREMDTIVLDSLGHYRKYYPQDLFVRGVLV